MAYPWKKKADRIKDFPSGSCLMWCMGILSIMILWQPDFGPAAIRPS
jgi:hypothetical protein